MRDRLERHQVWLYLAAILVGLGLGLSRPEAAGLLEGGLWPLLAALLFATFTQIPMSRLVLAFRDTRFLGALLAGNFVMLPIALALPEAWQAAVVVIVLQSLVELFGMLAFLRWVPGRLLPER